MTPRLHRVARPALFGVVAFLVSFAFSWVPSPWGDEAATVLSADRPWPSLARMLTTVDAVHGVYYALMHVWIDAFGQSMTALRLPSAVAVGVATAGVVVLGDRLGSRRIGTIAGAVFLVLPRVTFMGGEARSYALSAAAAVWFVVLIVHLLRGPGLRPRVWFAYSLALAASIAIFLYLGLLLPAVAAAVVAPWLWRGRQRGRCVVVEPARWIRFTLLGILLAGPVVGFAIGQRNQISFLGDEQAITLHTLVVTQWFGSSPVAVFGWSAIAVALVVGVWESRRDTRAHDAAASLLALSAAAVFVPMLILVVVNALVAPIYTTRYLSFATPFVALLMALGISTITRRFAVHTVVVVGLAVLVLPVYVAQRQPFAQDGGSDWAEVARAVGERARPGDAIVFDDDVGNSRKPRAVKYFYRSDFAGLVDVALKTPYAQTSGIRDVTRSIEASAAALRATDGRVWFVDYRGHSDDRPKQLAELERLGYRVTLTVRLHRDTLYRLDRRA